MGGGMETNKNKFIEDWGSARENLEHNFRWTRRNFALIGIFGIALPILVYKGVVKDFHMQDEDAGRPHRKFLQGSLQRHSLHCQTIKKLMLEPSFLQFIQNKRRNV
ncbi:uncharacterized protein BNAA05G11280D [Brassica napus]|nr:uncharacterized protein BNAA05G11280D [Brassica napus]